MDESPRPPISTPPPPNGAAAATQHQQDLQHLRVLSILHYVYGSLVALGGCGGVMYAGFGAMMAAMPEKFADNGQPPALIGIFMIAIGGCMTLLLWAFGALVIYAGVCLANQRRRIFCTVIAALNCLWVPLGTILGVLTLIVLSRPSVAALFRQSESTNA